MKMGGWRKQQDCSKPGPHEMHDAAQPRVGRREVHIVHESERITDLVRIPEVWVFAWWQSCHASSELLVVPCDGAQRNMNVGALLCIPEGECDEVL